jgi:dolichyl-phosphate beta-glucosyltransferase
VRRHSECEFGDDYEVIVVDDGSDDGVLEMIERMMPSWSQLRALRYESNRGKGAAVRLGMLAGIGELLLFTDADGATPISEERKLRAAIEAGAHIAIGSRLVPSGETNQRRKWPRRLGGWLFSRSVHSLVDVPVRDTQCGFKMFRRQVGLRLFGLCNEDGYLFDVFVLRLAVRLGYRIAEVDVNWHEVAGSKVRLLRDSYKMLRQLYRLERRVDEAMAGSVSPPVG